MPRLNTGYGSFRQLITGDSQYVVPPYQRPFAWRLKREILDIWEDVASRYLAQLPESDTYDEREETHFLGSVVIGQGGAPDPLGVTKFVVIDGQQRLLTLSLLITAIRDVLVLDADRRLDITGKYLAHVSRSGEIESLRLVPGESDFSLYREIVAGNLLPPSTDRLVQAYRFFTDQLAAGMPVEGINLRDEEEPESVTSEREVDLAASKEHEGEEEEDTLPPVDSSDVRIPFAWDRLITVVLDRLELVTISDVSEENAYQIFRTLNSTGLELGQVDLLRNAFFMILPTRGHDVYRNIWRPMEQLLGSDLERFFHTQLLRRGENIPRDQTYRTQMKLLKRSGTGEAEVEQTLTELHADSSTFAALLGIGGGGPSLHGRRMNADLRAALSRLRTWRSDPTYPLVLEALIRWLDSGIGDGQLLRLLVGIESLLVRRFIREIAPNDLRSTFGILMRQLRDREGEFYSNALELLLSPQRRWPTDDDIRDACRTQAMYRPGKQRQSFYVLKRIAENIEGRERPEIVLGTHRDEYSIEHILPQHLTDDWLQDLADWGDPDPMSTWRDRRDVIGNLTLTAYNPELSNARFSQKKDWIDSHLRLEMSRRILEARSWSQAEIDARSDALATHVVAIWPRDRL